MADGGPPVTGGVFKSAAFEVLRSEQRLMTSGEITKLAIERRLLRCMGKTPENTMASALYTEVRKKAATTVFIKPKEGLFGLKAWLSEPWLLHWLAQEGVDAADLLDPAGGLPGGAGAAEPTTKRARTSYNGSGSRGGTSTGYFGGGGGAPHRTSLNGLALPAAPRTSLNGLQLLQGERPALGGHRVSFNGLPGPGMGNGPLVGGGHRSSLNGLPLGGGGGGLRRGTPGGSAFGAPGASDSMSNLHLLLDAADEIEGGPEEQPRGGEASQEPEVEPEADPDAEHDDPFPGEGLGAGRPPFPRAPTRRRSDGVGRQSSFRRQRSSLSREPSLPSIIARVRVHDDDEDEEDGDGGALGEDAVFDRRDTQLPQQAHRQLAQHALNAQRPPRRPHSQPHAHPQFVSPLLGSGRWAAAEAADAGASGDEDDPSGRRGSGSEGVPRWASATAAGVSGGGGGQDEEARGRGQGRDPDEEGHHPGIYRGPRGSRGSTRANSSERGRGRSRTSDQRTGSGQSDGLHGGGLQSHREAETEAAGAGSGSEEDGVASLQEGGGGRRHLHAHAGGSSGRPLGTSRFSPGARATADGIAVLPPQLSGAGLAPLLGVSAGLPLGGLAGLGAASSVREPGALPSTDQVVEQLRAVLASNGALGGVPGLGLGLGAGAGTGAGGGLGPGLGLGLGGPLQPPLGSGLGFGAGLGGVDVGELLAGLTGAGGLTAAQQRLAAAASLGSPLLPPQLGGALGLGLGLGQGLGVGLGAGGVKAEMDAKLEPREGGGSASGSRGGAAEDAVMREVDSREGAAASGAATGAKLLRVPASADGSGTGAGIAGGPVAVHDGINSPESCDPHAVDAPAGPHPDAGLEPHRRAEAHPPQPAALGQAGAVPAAEAAAAAAVKEESAGAGALARQPSAMETDVPLAACPATAVGLGLGLGLGLGTSPSGPAGSATAPPADADAAEVRQQLGAGSASSTAPCAPRLPEARTSNPGTGTGAAGLGQAPLQGSPGPASALALLQQQQLELLPLVEAARPGDVPDPEPINRIRQQVADMEGRMGALHPETGRAYVLLARVLEHKGTAWSLAMAERALLRAWTVLGAAGTQRRRSESGAGAAAVAGVAAVAAAEAGAAGASELLCQLPDSFTAFHCFLEQIRFKQNVLRTQQQQQLRMLLQLLSSAGLGGAGALAASSLAALVGVPLTAEPVLGRGVGEPAAPLGAAAAMPSLSAGMGQER